MPEPDNSARAVDAHSPAGAAGAAAASAQESGEEKVLIAALRRGEEAAFVTLVQRYQRLMLRVASQYVSSRAVAEEVVQETWLGLVQGIHKFEERSLLKTWIFRILVNRAITRGERESGTVAFSALADSEIGTQELAVEADRFLGAGDQWPGHWSVAPRSWGQDPEKALLAREAQEVLRKAVEALPQAQRMVVTLRDIQGWTSEEVCNVLVVSETNQRVLLHRARSKVRRALEAYFDNRLVD